VIDTYFRPSISEKPATLGEEGGSPDFWKKKNRQLFSEFFKNEKTALLKIIRRLKFYEFSMLLKNKQIICNITFNMQIKKAFFNLKMLAENVLAA
jgi:hypothetical protein